MYDAPTLYTKECTYNAMADRDYFRTALTLAKDNINPSVTKDTVPVIFASTLKNQTKEEDIVTRKTVQDKERAKRRFLMIDADFNADQTDESADLWNTIIEFGKKYQTPVMMYPTLSYPAKPRFRAVFLVKRLLDDKNYEKAMRWLYDELTTPVLDKSDLRINANRNLPVFTNQEQANKAYTTFDDELLQPLDNALWKDTKLPKRPKATHTVNRLSEDGLTYDWNILRDCADSFAHTSFCASYETFWRVVQSTALDILDGAITEAQGEELMTIFAHGAAENDAHAAQWEKGNRELLKKHMDMLRSGATDLSQATPLYGYSELSMSIDIE